MNRKVATSDGSQIDEAIRDAANEGVEVVVRSQPIEDASGAGASEKTKEAPPKASAVVKAGARTAAARGAGRGQGDVGQLLRGAYRETVDEAIPDDLMDLLNKRE